MTHSPKICLLGAGSAVFTRNLLGDILSYPELAGSDIVLHDIDQKRLDLAEMTAKRIADAVGAKPRIAATTDRRKALEGVNYAINTIQVQGYRPATVIDFEIPKKYGVEQTIADTLGIGGIMRALRTIPVLQEMTRDMAEVAAPGVVHLNYVNPMAMITWALNRLTPSVPTIGLCHSVQLTLIELAEDLGIPVEEIEYHCAGINHMAFYLKLKHNGESLYPRLRRIVEENKVPEWNRVRYEVMRRLGYFVTESSEHFAEYVPWFIKPGREDLLKTFTIPLDEYPGRCELHECLWPFIENELKHPGTQNIEEAEAAVAAADIKVMPRMIKKPRSIIEGLRTVKRSVEYGSSIIRAMETGQPCVINGNVPNHGLIDNLPQGCAVEVPCLVDRNGVQPTRVGALPPQLAGLMRTNVNVQELVVEAIINQDREHVYHAAMLDPRTAATLDVEQIHSLVDDLLKAHRPYLPAFLQ